ncbi:AAA family ATPase [Dinghuibacter silviterrae]|uniref:AAA15 family ATPase/GTPase n=1 Tax=Dinghuibacter silviterrae TaxID=1539049 RepID=A0A4R8DUG5_9BACT|nr:AAA family ATPase [Dinghuibacter silviterrae]TDX01057.1 AAA15 family ATPase/GTPase [Dinghuibacter silviterrae]
MAQSRKSVAQNAKLTPLEITNFKSIKHIRLETSRINIFIGKPNSGKSNLLEAMTLFNFIERGTPDRPSTIRYKSLNQLFYDTDTSKNVTVKFGDEVAKLMFDRDLNTFIQAINPNESTDAQNYSLNEPSSSIAYEFELSEHIGRPKKYKGQFASKMAMLNADGSTLSTGKGAIHIENPVRKYDFKDGHSYGENFSRYLKQHGENLYSIVRERSEIRDWIKPFFDEYGLDFLMDFNTRTFEVQRIENGIAYKIPFELTPDTLRRMLFNIAAIYSNSGSVILFEEPEAHSFPPYIKELSELIKADKHNTYFITTHSPYFFSSMVEDSITYKDICFFQVYFEDYQTKIKKLSQKELDLIWGSGVDVFFNIDSSR